MDGLTRNNSHEMLISIKFTELSMPLLAFGMYYRKSISIPTFHLGHAAGHV
ncbi:MAG: hypothetical protein M3Y53_08160 [Thermoproteota archaeon]|nr:hypothetical protein [Thermoproteota archaeon]